MLQLVWKQVKSSQTPMRQKHVLKKEKTNFRQWITQNLHTEDILINQHFLLADYNASTTTHKAFSIT